jgi:aryl-alcohol dehydrogenase-like predicted oxidoreductase
MQFLRRDAGGARRAEGRALESLRVHRDQIHELEDLADEPGHQPGDVALAWLLAQPAVTAPSIRPRTQEQLDAALRALDVELDVRTLIRLDAFFPGCRTASEAYAW